MIAFMLFTGFATYAILKALVGDAQSATFWLLYGFAWYYVMNDMAKK